MSEPTSRTTYLDHFASSPMWPEARKALIAELERDGANPSSVHRPARASRRALDDARDALGSVLGCRGDEVVFTSGGTEANNLALFGSRAKNNGAIVVSAIEHHSVLVPAAELNARVVAVTSEGLVDLDSLERCLDEDVALVSVMTVNNEVGVVQPLEAVAKLVRERAPRALLHTDAVQAVATTDVAALVECADLVSVSGHKFGGPQGVGALVVRAGVAERVAPQIRGGAQERELRAGTENVPAAVAMGVAATITASRRAEVTSALAVLRDRLLDGVCALSPRVSESVPRAIAVAASCHIRVAGIVSEELLFVLDDLGIAASAGAACASGALEPSHVLVAMGWSEQAAREAVRFSLGPTTDDEAIGSTIDAMRTALSRLGAGR